MSTTSVRSTEEGVEEISTKERKDGLVVEAPPREISTMTMKELNNSVLKYSIPTSWGPRLAMRNERIHSNLSGYFAVSDSFFSVGGMRLPYALIIDELCAAYQLMPSQIPPNSWKFINGLALLCHQFGCPPSIGILRHFMRLSQSPISGAGIPSFQYRDARYRPAGTASKVSSWRTKYFFVKSPGSTSEHRPWRYPLAEQWNDISSISLSGEEWSVVDRIKALGRYDFARLILGYFGGASANSFLLDPPPRIIGLGEEAAPPG